VDPNVVAGEEPNRPVGAGADPNAVAGAGDVPNAVAGAGDDPNVVVDELEVPKPKEGAGVFEEEPNEKPPPEGAGVGAPPKEKAIMRDVVLESAASMENCSFYLLFAVRVVRK
jgi:hypothetical protein